MNKLIVLIALVAGGLAFGGAIRYLEEDKPVFIPSSPQRQGDAQKGFSYLTTGDYLKSGVPYNYFKLGFGKSSVNYLKRDGYNRDIPYEYTAVKAPNGEIVVAPNCLQCHAQVFRREIVHRLGQFHRRFCHQPQTGSPGGGGFRTHIEEPGSAKV